MMQEWIGPLIGVLGAAVVGQFLALLNWKGKSEEAIAQQGRVFERHLGEAEAHRREFQQVKERQAVMRQEIVDMAARLIAGDERLKELHILSRNFAVMESELKGIRVELVEIKQAIRNQPE